MFRDGGIIAGRRLTISACDRNWPSIHWLLYLNVEPKIERISSDPRFAALRRRLNLPK
jgi:hypothetical protein